MAVTDMELELAAAVLPAYEELADATRTRIAALVKVRSLMRRHDAEFHRIADIEQACNEEHQKLRQLDSHIAEMRSSMRRARAS